VKIRCLTISEPWASLIASGNKTTENRCWKTNYRGPLAIHAGSGTQYLTKKRLADYPVGHVIAVANLVACLDIQTIRQKAASVLDAGWEAYGCSSTWAEIAAHEFTVGPFCWILEGVRKLKTPKPIAGKQGIWTFFDREWGSRF
jgi:hypothetical protein